jgi:hypothetical protein
VIPDRAPPPFRRHGRFRTAAGLAALALSATGCGGGGDGGTEPPPEVVASVTVEPAVADLEPGQTRSFAATPRTATGSVITGKQITWTAADPAVATVTTGGVVTAVAPGSTDLTAAVGGVSGRARVTVTVAAPPNLAITDVRLTQAVQAADGSVPMVPDGRPVLVNVIGSLNRPFPGTRPRIRVSIYEGSMLRLTDERDMTGSPGSAAGEGAPVHQVVVPPDLVRPGLAVKVEANPTGPVTEERLDDNTWPATGGPREVPVRQVSPLEIHLVPIQLTLGSTVGNVGPATVAEYLTAINQMYPLGAVSVTIGDVLSTDVNFGTGQPDAWLQILPALDARRMVEGTRRYYVGAIRPPSGVTFVQNGGWSYIPLDPLSSGPGTRTSLVVGVGWFNRTRQTTELVAHEIGHTHGRRHVPCGATTVLDPFYPHAGGSLGSWGNDLYSSASVPIPGIGPTEASDIMSYCTPAWISDYTYRALLEVRSADGAVASPASVPCACLLIWGTATPSGVTLSPVFEVAARAARPDATGPYRLEGITGDGRVLFSHAFGTSPVDHAPDVGQFLFSLSVTEADRQSLASIRVVDPFGRVTATPAASSAPVALAARRVGPDVIELTWDPAAAAGILVRDPASGQVIGIGRSGRLPVMTRAGAVSVAMSRGARSSTAMVRVR